MKKIYYLLASAALLLSGCDIKDVVPDNKVNYDYLLDCIWTPATSDMQTELTGLLLGPDNTVFFMPGNKMVVTKLDDGQYTYITHYDYKIDYGTDILTFSEDPKNNYFLFHFLCQTNMTLFYRSDTGKILMYDRIDFPDADQFDQGSFPEGWFVR